MLSRTICGELQFSADVRITLTMNSKDVLKLLRNRIKAAGSQRDVAEALDVSVQYLNDVLKGRREPGDAILKGLGLKRKIEYVKR